MLRLLCALTLALSLAACTGGGFSLPAVTSGPASDLPGKIVWRDLLTDTPEATRTFYRELFGWEFQALGIGVNYELILHEGRPIGGLVDQAQLPSQADISQWVVVMAVSDIDVATAAVNAAGGKVLTPPASLGERGEIAVIADNQDALLALLQTPGGEPLDTDATPAVGGFLWDELWTADTAAAARFYSNLAPFAVDPIDLDEQGAEFDYQLLLSEDRPRAGIRPRPAADLPPTWVSFLRIADGEALRAVLARVPELGGEILVPATPRPGGGEVAIITGPSGAGIALQTWSEDRGPVGLGGDA
ncbi:MAG: VOC family protein [Pseudomonadota bacterium]